MPEYTVIAGPNGAGKSTFSAILSSGSALIFDADKVKAASEKQFPDIPDESIGMMIDSAYWEAEEIAEKENRDLTVETNLRDDFLIKRSKAFKNKVFTTNLIYLLLPDIETSTDRVSLRVAQKGHFIDPLSIKYNFEKGLMVLKEHFEKFDNLLIVNSILDDKQSTLQQILILKNNKIHFIEPNIPLWAKPVIDGIIKKIIN